jgi:hypothetical protein
VARVISLAPDLFFASKVEATLGAAGHDVTTVATQDAAAAAAEGADLLIADLHAAGLDPASLRGGVGVKPVLAYYSHVDTEARRRGEEAGFELVVPRSRMARELPALVERLLAARG